MANDGLAKYAVKTAIQELDDFPLYYRIILSGGNLRQEGKEKGATQMV